MDKDWAKRGTHIFGKVLGGAKWLQIVEFLVSRMFKFILLYMTELYTHLSKMDDVKFRMKITNDSPNQFSKV